MPLRLGQEVQALPRGAGLTGLAPLAPSAALLDLNNAHAVELSVLTEAAFARLAGLAFHARQAGEADAFLIALDQDADYDNPNFRWMRSRFERFVYVDRVVVAARARGRGLARILYEDLFAAARSAGQTRITCEVNSDPPNPASDAFHARLGFAEVGAATLPGGAKTVRYLSRTIAL